MNDTARPLLPPDLKKPWCQYIFTLNEGVASPGSVKIVNDPEPYTSRLYYLLTRYKADLPSQPESASLSDTLDNAVVDAISMYSKLHIWQSGHFQLAEHKCGGADKDTLTELLNQLDNLWVFASLYYCGRDMLAPLKLDLALFDRDHDVFSARLNSVLDKLTPFATNPSSLSLLERLVNWIGHGDVLHQRSMH